MTARLHAASGMPQLKTSQHQTALGSVSLIALDVGFIGSRRPSQSQGGQEAEPDFSSRCRLLLRQSRALESDSGRIFVCSLGATASVKVRWKKSVSAAEDVE